MLRVAKLLNVDPTVIKGVAKELRSIDATNIFMAVKDVLRIQGRGRVYLFLLSDDVRDDLPLGGDLQASNWTGECPSLICD